MLEKLFGRSKPIDVEAEKEKMKLELEKLFSAELTQVVIENLKPEVSPKQFQKIRKNLKHDKFKHPEHAVVAELIKANTKGFVDRDVDIMKETKRNKYFAKVHKKFIAGDVEHDIGKPSLGEMKPADITKLFKELEISFKKIRDNSSSAQGAAFIHKKCKELNEVNVGPYFHLSTDKIESDLAVVKEQIGLVSKEAAPTPSTANNKVSRLDRLKEKQLELTRELDKRISPTERCESKIKTIDSAIEKYNQKIDDLSKSIQYLKSGRSALTQINSLNKIERYENQIGALKEKIKEGHNIIIDLTTELTSLQRAEEQASSQSEYSSTPSQRFGGYNSSSGKSQQKPPLTFSREARGASLKTDQEIKRAASVKVPPPPPRRATAKTEKTEAPPPPPPPPRRPKS